MDTSGLRVAELWRYPVKSLAGERLDRAVVTTNGIVGDRVVHVRDRRDRVVTARNRPRLLALHGTLGPDREPLIDGRPWTAPESVAAVREAAGPEASLTRYDGPERFDVLPLLVATDGAIAALDVDGRRLRPNIVIGGVTGVAERQWPGRRLRIGDVVISMEKLRGRCVMTTWGRTRRCRMSRYCVASWRTSAGRWRWTPPLCPAGPSRSAISWNCCERPHRLLSASARDHTNGPPIWTRQKLHRGRRLFIRLEPNPMSQHTDSIDISSWHRACY
jgi:hypothetical protein